MNIQTKNRLRSIAQYGKDIVYGFLETIASIFRIILFSRISVAVKSKTYRNLRHHDDCTILANGPSLKEAMENGRVKLDDVDVFCVNSFCESEYFWKVKPTSYFIVDGEFFNPTTERTKKQVTNLIEALNKVDWRMNLCISSHAINGGVLSEIKNDNINVLRFNTTTIVGYEWFCHSLYKIRIGMPLCINVVIFSIMAAINMKYKNIYMYGIDHTFSAQLFVDDENCVCSMEWHVYATEGRALKLPNTTMTEILRDMSNCFAMHEKLNRYSLRVGSKIWNCTKGSFVDAYERIIKM